jgi:hypothetical protein
VVTNPLEVSRFLLLQKRYLTTRDGGNACNAGAIAGTAIVLPAVRRFLLLQKTATVVNFLLPAVRRFLLLQKRHSRHPWRSHIPAVLAAYFEEGVGDLTE